MLGAHPEASSFFFNAACSHLHFVCNNCQTSSGLPLQISLDLASFEVVRSCQDTLLKLLREGLVDILFCNTAEAEALAEVRPTAEHCRAAQAQPWCH